MKGTISSIIPDCEIPHWLETGMETTVIHKELKRTISASGRLGSLPMVSESNIERCASKDVGVGMPVKMLDQRGGL